jgi:hypothetical protein
MENRHSRVIEVGGNAGIVVSEPGAGGHARSIAERQDVVKSEER